MTKDKTVVVSDLHVDTWSQERKLFGKTKLQHFFDFLDWIEPFSRTFVINGDLFDAPAPKGAGILPQYQDVLLRLIQLAETTTVYYFIGNHDLSLVGLDVRGYNNLHVIYPYYPHVQIKPEPTNDNLFIYLEHGHFYDPVLSDYIYQVVKKTYPITLFGRMKRLPYRLLGLRDPILVRQGMDAGTLNHALVRAAQRRDPQTGDKTHPIGAHQWQHLWHNLTTRVWKKLARQVTKYYTPGHWQNAAQGVFEDFCRNFPEKEIKAVIFGHTHLPDEQRMSYRGKEAIYLNSGDWTEPVLDKDPPTHHSSFIIFDSQGDPELGPDGHAVRDYIAEAREARADHVPLAQSPR